MRLAVGIFHLIALLLALIQYSRPYIWQSVDAKEAYIMHFYDRYMRIPPSQVTARKFAHFFLNRDANAELYYHKRLKRAHDPIDLKPEFYYDIAFLIDSSTSVGRRNFKLALRVLRGIIKRGMRNAHYAAITYSKKAKVEFNFTSPREARSKLHQIEYRPGNTNTQDALHVALRKLFEDNKSRVRSGSKRRVLLITDGLSNVQNHLTLFRAFQLKASGIEVFIVAVGRYLYGMQEIVGMASTTYAHLYRVTNMKGFAHVIKLIPERPIGPEKTWLTGMHAASFVFKQTTKTK